MQNRFTRQVTQHRFIDKSYLINAVLYDGAKIKNFVIPKGFGKSMNLDMLHSFFSNRLNHGSYFNNLEISESHDLYDKHQGQYPVIYLNFSTLCSPSLEDSLKQFRSLIIQLYQSYQDILLDHADKDNQAKIQAILDNSAGISSYISAIEYLTEELYKTFKKGVIILIDDYDLPLNKAREHFYAHELVMYFFDIFTSVFKNNEALDMAILMGKENFPTKCVYSGLNNITVNTFYNRRYTPYFGFSPDEVEDEINKLYTQCEFDTNELVEQLCHYYGGYYVKDSQLLNSQCVDQFITSLEDNKINFRLDLFDDIQSIIIFSTFEKNKETLLLNFKKLSEGEPIISEVYMQTDYQRYKDKNLAYFWGHMVNFGYLTYKKISDKDYNNKAALQVPNLTAKQFFAALQELVFEPVVPTQLSFQHEIRNLDRSCIGLFAFNTSDLQYQDKRLYKRLLHHIECSKITDTQFMQEITSAMETFCQLSVYDRREKRDQLRKFLIALEEKSNMNVYQAKR